MNKTRCPWCGKCVDRYSDQKNARKKKKYTPKYGVFAQCGHCHQYYGQSVGLYKICALGLIISIFLIALGIYVAIFTIPIIIVAMLIGGSYQRLNEDETLTDMDDTLRFEAKLLECQGRLGRKKMYFFNDRIDDFDAFAMVSPIYITSLKRKKQLLSGYFLYEHPENKELIKQSCITVFRANGSPVAKIRFVESE